MTPSDEHSSDRRAGPLRDDERHCAAKQREHQRLRHRLPQEPPATDTQGEADRGFAPAAKRSRENDNADVCAGDEQHDPGHDAHPERGARLERWIGAGARPDGRHRNVRSGTLD